LVDRGKYLSTKDKLAGKGAWSLVRVTLPTRRSDMKVEKMPKAFFGANFAACDRFTYNNVLMPGTAMLAVCLALFFFVFVFCMN